MIKINRHFCWLLGVALVLIFLPTSSFGWPMECLNSLKENNFFPEQKSSEMVSQANEDEEQSMTEEQLPDGTIIRVQQEDGCWILHKDDDDIIQDAPEDNDDQNEPWKLVDIPKRQNPLDDYCKFAQQRDKIISGISIDVRGKTSFFEQPDATTLGGKMCQFIFTDNRAFVEDYYKVLQHNYGTEIASEAFSNEQQKRALQFGLSSDIVFNSLKMAQKQMLEKICQEFSAQQGSSHLLESDASIKNMQVSNEPTQNKFWNHVNKIRLLLEQTPDDTPAYSLYDNSPDPRSQFAKITDALTQLVDIAMLGQSSVIWARRSLFVMRLFW